MSIVLDEHSIAYIILNEWVPTLITILVGGLCASILFPRWQYHYSRVQGREERKHALAEDLSRQMRRYAVAWHRQRTLAELEISRQGALSEEETARKRQFVEARNASRDALLDTLCSIEIYFSAEVRQVIDDFIAWDEKNTVARMSELPPREEYACRRQAILELVHREVSK